MNLADLQAELRHFAAERDWQPFHTPKNLSMALMVEAAELAEIFQWMTPEESQRAHHDPASKQRIAGEIADVLLYLLQVADHSQIDIAHAVKDKLARNAIKYPAKQAIVRVSPTSAATPGTHVLLDYENVQPTEADLRAMVPNATQLWVFHGPHQKDVDLRFASFGAQVTPVPISKTGKNALDFHLSFYMGYIAARNQASTIVVVANDKGYAPILVHARDMGFAVQQLGHARTRPDTSAKATSQSKADAVAKSPAKKATPKKATAKKVAAKPGPSKKAAATKAAAVAPAAKKAVAASGHPKVPASPVAKVRAASPLALSTTLLEKMTDNLRKMDQKRPVKPASLRRALKSFLGAAASSDSIEAALGKLVSAGVVAVSEAGGVTYPGLARK